MQKPPTDRAKWQALTWLVGVVSATGRLAGGRPQSLLLVAPPGAGKSALLNRFRFEIGDPRNGHMVFASNASAWGLSEILKARVPQGVTHFVAPELQTLMLRKGHVWDSLVGLLLPAMEEGVYDVYNGPNRTSYGGARIGLIAAMPTDSFYKNARELQDTGLLSRMLVVHFDRSQENFLLSRYAVNAGDLTELQKVDCGLPAQIDVALPAGLANAIARYAAGVNAANGHREANRFEALTKIVAWLDGKKAASDAHLAQIVQWESFWKTQG